MVLKCVVEHAEIAGTESKTGHSQISVNPTVLYGVYGVGNGYDGSVVLTKEIALLDALIHMV